jgi:hypothetical protein
VSRGRQQPRGPFGDPETGIGRYSDAEIARAIRTGVLPDGELSVFMTISQGNPSDEDLVAILSYLRSAPPVRNEVPRGTWSLLGKVLLRAGMFPFKPRAAEGPKGAPAGVEPSVERGRYLAEDLAFCEACHTPFDMATFEHNGPPFSGGTPEPSHGEDEEFEFAPPNLTSSPVGYTGRLDEDAFVARFKVGGRVYKSSVMPWESFSTMTESDIRSIYRFLRTVPPSDVDNGPPYRKLGTWPPGP